MHEPYIKRKQTEKKMRSGNYLSTSMIHAGWYVKKSMIHEQSERYMAL